ncbi:RNase H domain-containing protein [Trichonephila clavipes]|nr:RNase H domain-containing protein [Trichonephila clavipes]
MCSRRSGVEFRRWTPLKSHLTIANGHHVAMKKRTGTFACNGFPSRMESSVPFLLYAGIIICNISCDIITLLEQLHNKRKSCIMQWIPAHVNIEGNECADIYIYSLAKEARDVEHKCTTITLDDANAVAKHGIMNHTFKKPLVTEFDCPRIITSTIARLRTEHLKGMKIHPDKTRSYVQCKHCPDLQLTPNHILECPTVATKLLKMGMVPLRDSLWELLYSPDAPRIAEAVIKTFEGI